MSKKQHIIIQCPHCDYFILIEKLNCCIFRHGVFIKTNKQINSHESKELCDSYVNNKLIYGCGKPYRIIKNEKDEYIAVICDYI